MIERTRDGTIGKTALYYVPDRKQETLFPLMMRHIIPGSMVLTDGGVWYNSSTLWDKMKCKRCEFKHKTFNPITKKEVIILGGTNQIESWWHTVKQVIRRQYATIPEKNLESYILLAEWHARRNKMCADKTSELKELFRDLHLKR